MNKKYFLLKITISIVFLIGFYGCEDDIQQENFVPKFTVINDQELTAGEVKSITVLATDFNGDSLSFSIKDNPGFLSIGNYQKFNNVTTAELVIAPEANVCGVFDVCIEACDCFNARCEENIKISVNTIISIDENVCKQRITTERVKEVQFCACDHSGGNIDLLLLNNPGFVSIKDWEKKGDTIKANLSISPGKLDKGNYKMFVVAKGEHGVADSTTLEIEVNDPINVITVYFCGTRCTAEMWQSSKSVFGKPELVATLFKRQYTEKDSIHNYYKHIVNGVGTGGGLNVLAQGFPSLPGVRGWNVCLGEATSYIFNLLPEVRGKIYLNIVGFSRGGILAMMLADAYKDVDAISRINILAFDPVPGDDFDKNYSKYLLSPKVNHYIGLYAEDERTRYFQPIIPMVASSNTKFWIFTMPGSHETMIGNIQKGGHSEGHKNVIDIVGYRYDKIPYLLNVVFISHVVATEVFYSKEWGNVRFNLPWDRSKELFMNKYELIYNYNDYEDMRTISFLAAPTELRDDPFLEFWLNLFGEIIDMPTAICVYHKTDSSAVNAYKVCFESDMKKKLYNHPRIAYMYNGGNFDHIGLTNELKKLKETPAWDELIELLEKPR